MISFLVGSSMVLLDSFAEGAMLGVSVYLASKGIKRR